MPYAIQDRPASVSAPAPAPSRTFALGIRDALRATFRDLAGAWRYASARREFNRVDQDTLRDLGISRSEFDSYWAETHGMAEPTRVRVTRQTRGSGL
jgi:uncharacterized protein YjiS (DUF1127 family)